MSFKPVQRLDVTRTLASARRVTVGVLAQNKQGVYFQFNEDYLHRYSNLSPFLLASDTSLQKAPNQPHSGLHGVFSDSLPDGWGMLLQDRVFRQNGIQPTQITAMDRLAFVGARGIGALCYSPESSFEEFHSQLLNLEELGLEAQSVFDGQTDEVLADLVAAGSSGGARPKAQIYFDFNDFSRCSTEPFDDSEAWLVKFTSSNLALGHQEGVCEAVYLELAERAGLNPPEWRLLSAPEKSGASHWLAVKRFDVTAAGGRLHVHSACGLLDADYRMPSLDYEQLIKASRHLCQSPAVGRLQFKRAVFNLLASNQDDHSKNWAFLQEDSGEWQPAPFYDVTYSPHPFNEHATSFGGFGRQPPLKTMQALAARAGYASWEEARIEIQMIADVVSGFERVAREFGVDSETVKMIQKTLNERLQENKVLM